MVKRRSWLAALAAGALLAVGAPQRIVSTAPNVTEMLFALGLGERVVGVTSFCRYPPEARTKAKVGSFASPSLETILSLRPDLVVVVKNPVQLAERLRALRLRVLELDPQTMAGIEHSIIRLGAEAGVPERARELTARIRAELDEVRRRTAAFPRRRMMFIVGRTPGALQGIVAAGKASYLSELIDVAGGVNVLADSPAAYPQISIEQVLARDPETILDMGDMADTEGVTEQQKRAVVALWKRFPTLAAVRAGRVYAVASDVLVVPGPRVAEAAREFARLLHPEAGL